jgi:hypothetical protein
MSLQATTDREPATADEQATARCAEYVLIGPHVPDLSDICRSFAKLPVQIPEAGCDPRRTLDIPSVTVHLLDLADGRRLVRVDDHRGGSASLYATPPAHAIGALVPAREECSVSSAERPADLPRLVNPLGARRGSQR